MLFIKSNFISLLRKTKIGGASAIKLNEFILYCSQLALSLLRKLFYMDSLFKIYLRLLQETDAKTFRYLYPNIDWSERCIAIVGAKGVGKTTMLLQHIKNTFDNKNEALFVSLDNTWFANHSIFDLDRKSTRLNSSH